MDGGLLIFAKLWAAPVRPGARGRRRPKTLWRRRAIFGGFATPWIIFFEHSNPSGFEQGAVRGELTAHRSVMLPQNGRGQDGSEWKFAFYPNAGSAGLLFI